MSFAPRYTVPTMTLSSRTVLLMVLWTMSQLVIHVAWAGQRYSQADAERYIQESEAAWAASVATSDASVVKRILADDVIWVLDGEILDKTRAVADAADGPGDFLSNRLEYAHVRFFGDTAVVQGSETWTRKGGKAGRFVWTDTWLRRNDQWQIVASEDVSVPLAGPPPGK